MNIMYVTRCAGVVALLGLAGVPGLAHAEGLRGDGPRGVPAARPVPDPATQAAQEAAAAKMRGRMTPEERRRLREDVFDAGRSLYPVEKAGAPARRPGKGG